MAQELCYPARGSSIKECFIDNYFHYWVLAGSLGIWRSAPEKNMGHPSTGCKSRAFTTVVWVVRAEIDDSFPGNNSWQPRNNWHDSRLRNSRITSRWRTMTGRWLIKMEWRSHLDYGWPRTSIRNPCPLISGIIPDQQWVILSYETIGQPRFAK